jgi:hypothetical protein
LQKNLLLPRIDNVREVKANKEWDLKKIVTSLLVLIALFALFLFFKFYFFANADNSLKIADVQKASVKGISTENIKKAVQERVDLIKEQADSINVTDIATSSPQVQKLIKDIKALENYPSSQARSMCENLCKSL